MNLNEAIELKTRFINEVNQTEKDLFVGSDPFELQKLINACKLEYTISSQLQNDSAIKILAASRPNIKKYNVYVVNKGELSFDNPLTVYYSLDYYIRKSNIKFSII